MDRQTDLDGLRSHWRAALSAAEAALTNAGGFLGPADLHAHRRHLSEEYGETVGLLQAFAHDEGLPLVLAQPFVPRAEAQRLLRLPAGVSACVFNLDGVLVGSAAVHAAAWKRTFDEFLADRTGPAGHSVPLFDPAVDYPAHLHGRPRVEGVRTFLASRGIRVPEGAPGDAPGRETVHGLANRKQETLVRLLDEQGLVAYADSRRYLELARDAGVRCAVVSASAHAGRILEQTGLARLVDDRVDAELILAEHLRGRPAPDRLLAACRRLGVTPEHAAAFETDTAGIAAGRTAGFRLVVGVDRSEHTAHAQALRDEGADVVVPGLAELIERRAALAA